MRAWSLFSGVGGFELGFERAGIETVLQVESDPWCLGVLERHWPGVMRLDDVRKVDASTWGGRRGDVERDGSGPDDQRLGGAARGVSGADHRADGAAPEPARRGVPLGRDAADPRDGNGRDEPAVDIDLVYGGFPCQDVSVAGKRAGLSGERSSLWFEFERILRLVRPRWCAIENVPGLLSSNAGRDMATVLGGLGNLGYGWAYRVLDARWFGVPQRRRRVVIVGCLGDAARAAQVLAVCESCGGYPAAREEASEDVAPTLAAGAGVAGTLGSHHGNTRADQAWTGQLVAATLSGGGHPGSNLPGRHHEDDDNLVAFGGNNTSGAIDVAASRSARGNRYDFDTDTDTFLVASEIDDSMARPLVARATGYRMDLESENFVVANALRANQGTGRGWSGDRGDASDTLVVANGLRASDGHHGHSSGRGDGGDNLVVADPIGTREGKTYTHEGSHNFRTHNLISGVRRLTPLECERLMGFPDDWTRYAADGTPIADSHRYRMCGNGVVAVVAEWLGHRLVAVDALR